MSLHYQIAVNFPKVQSILTYKSKELLQIGDLVDVPLGKGNRTTQGVVLGVSDAEKLDAIENVTIKIIAGKIDHAFSLDDKELALYNWMARYYHYSLGKLVFDCLPKVLKRPKKIGLLKGRGVAIDKKLNPPQQEIYQKIEASLAAGFSQHYLHGVTGSGKSLVFLNLIKQTVESGKSAQFMLPEINLTPQFVAMFEEHLDCKILSYHSAVTPSEKYAIWKQLKESNEPVLVLGVRSSIFLPIQNLGLIIIDEEHDNSFKQSDRCPYNGRDVAIKKAQLYNCPVVLGSATPTVENYYYFSGERYNRHYYQLTERAMGASFPQIKLLDIKEKFTEDDPAWPLLDETLDIIGKRLNAGEQVLVFINKLGYSSYIQCRNCGHQFKNEKCGCENNLRYFKNKRCLSCAHCDFKMPVPNKCPDCGSISLLNKGFGTEKVQSVLQMAFQDKTVERFDRDEITSFSELNQKLDRFHQGEIDILVGTQMLSKGHNFQKVNLVVILGMDTMLNYSDFRASEKAYQMAMQVSGRAGRYGNDGLVVIQTMNPDHSIFQDLVAQNIDEFYKKEVQLRQYCLCPPFTKIAMLYFNGRFREKVVETSNLVARSLQKAIAGNFPAVGLYGPAPLGIEKKAGQYTWAIMLKSDDPNQLHNALNTFEQNYHPMNSVSYKIDVDPTQIL